jgi:hypothetical protein
MKVDIVQRVQRGDVVVRMLECGHEQEEQSGGESARATFAVCKACPGGKTPSHKAKPPPAKPVDTRTEVQRLAAEVRRVWSPPAGRPWGLDVVAIMKLLKAIEEPKTAPPAPTNSEG